LLNIGNQIPPRFRQALREPQDKLNQRRNLIKEPALAVKQPLAQSPAMPCATGSEPAFAGGIRRMRFALAEAYRVSHQISNPLYLVLAQNGMSHHQHSRDTTIYTMINSS
jgi:hypothetical protein